MKKFIFLMLAACFVLGIQSVQAQKHIGLATYSVKGIDSDPDRAFTEIAKIGYKTIEICNFNQQEGTVFGKKPAEFAEYVKGFGITVTSSHSSAGLDTENEADCLAKWETLCAYHEQMGCKYIIIPANMVWGNLDKVKATCALMNKIGAIAKKHNLTFLYHSHNMEFAKIEGTDLILEDYMIANTDPELVNFEMDVYWVMQGHQDPVAYLQKYPNRFKVLHIKDYYVVGASGKLNYEAIFNQFYKNGYQDFFVEMENESTIEQADAQAAKMFDGSMFREMANRPRPAAGGPGGRPQPSKEEQKAQLDKALKGIQESFNYLNNASFVK